MLILEKLISHGADNDAFTDEETREFHIKDCKKDLKKAIKQFLDEDPLELIRNIKDDAFSGIEVIDKNSSSYSPWYEETNSD
jgi:hypothetical protein